MFGGLPQLSGDKFFVEANPGSLVKFQDGISLRFSGWNPQEDGSGTNYTLPDEYTVGTSDVVLYAEWEVLGGVGPAGGLVFYDAGSDIGWGQYLEAGSTGRSEFRF